MCSLKLKSLMNMDINHNDTSSLFYTHYVRPDVPFALHVRIYPVPATSRVVLSVDKMGELTV